MTVTNTQKLDGRTERYLGCRPCKYYGGGRLRPEPGGLPCINAEVGDVVTAEPLPDPSIAPVPFT